DQRRLRDRTPRHQSNIPSDCRCGRQSFLPQHNEEIASACPRAQMRRWRALLPDVREWLVLIPATWVSSAEIVANAAGNKSGSGKLATKGTKNAKNTYPFSPFVATFPHPVCRSVSRRRIPSRCDWRMSCTLQCHGGQTMRSQRISVILGTLLFAAVVARADKVTFDYDRNVNFGKFKTFMWISE